MKVINLTYSNKGGAGNAVKRINSLISNFSDSIIISLTGESDRNTILLSKNTYGLIKKYKSLLFHFYFQKVKKVYLEEYNYYNYFEKYNYYNPRKIIKYFPFKPDILIIHITSHFINFKTIFELQKLLGCKIIFNLLDTSLLTGGCHYSWDCNGYKKDCKNCKAIINPKKNHLSYNNFKQKKSYLDMIDCRVNVSSTFALNQVSESSLFKNFKKSLIFYPISFEREGLYSTKENDEINILFGSQDLKDKRKGVKYFFEALHLLKSEINNELFNKLNFRIVGLKSSSFPKGFNFCFLGYLKMDELINEYINADLFVCSSVEDNGPMMINESIYFGTPVVAFNTGISNDLINRETGVKVENKNSTEFANGIIYYLKNRKSFDRNKIQKFSDNLFSKEIILNKWKELLNDTIQ